MGLHLLCMCPKIQIPDLPHIRIEMSIVQPTNFWCLSPNFFANKICSLLCRYNVYLGTRIMVKRASSFIKATKWAFYFLFQEINKKNNKYLFLFSSQWDKLNTMLLDFITKSIGKWMLLVKIGTLKRFLIGKAVNYKYQINQLIRDIWLR